MTRLAVAAEFAYLTKTCLYCVMYDVTRVICLYLFYAYGLCMFLINLSTFGETSTQRQAHCDFCCVRDVGQNDNGYKYLSIRQKQCFIAAA